MNAPLIPQANPGAAFRSRRDALLKAAALIRRTSPDHEGGTIPCSGMIFPSGSRLMVVWR